MSQPGGRADLAPYPDWAARYFVHRDPAYREFILRNGDLAGSWPVHLREADSQMVSFDRKPNFWLDARAVPFGTGPLGDLKATGPATPDNAHVPSLAYVPYLLTGDRYYADEMKFWAYYVLISTWPGMGNADRKGSRGLLVQNRSAAWPGGCATWPTRPPTYLARIPTAPTWARRW
jgi:hypothetical protein